MNAHACILLAMAFGIAIGFTLGFFTLAIFASTARAKAYRQGLADGMDATDNEVNHVNLVRKP